VAHEEPCARVSKGTDPGAQSVTRSGVFPFLRLTTLRILRPCNDCYLHHVGMATVR
jgi:hypothetical protein